jgi:hypothetical protein
MCLSPQSWPWKSAEATIAVGSIKPHQKEQAMALEPLATKGNYFHVYDFRVTPGF